jgi:hypothetical protein
MSAASDEFERIVRSIFQRLREHFGFERVEGSQYYPALDSGVKRQVDVTAYALDEKRIIIECKLHKEPVDIGYIDAFYTVIHVDVGAAGGIMVSSRGFTRGAVRSARAKKIDLAIVNEDATEHDFILQINGLVFGGRTRDIQCRFILAEAGPSNVD